MKKRIIAEYSYELPQITDKEIQDFFKSEGITDVDPEEVRRYIRERIYQLYCETLSKNNNV